MKPLPWSHSKLNAFEQCPRQFEEVQVLRHFTDTKHEAGLWGDRFHKAAEQFIGQCVAGGEVTPLGPDMLPYSGYLVQFVGRPGKTFVERRYALDEQLQPCDFFAPDVWCRAILDVLTLDGNVATVDDHKTGKNRKKDMQQLIIAALHVFYWHPEIDTCHTAFHWVQFGYDESAKDRETFYRHQIPELWMKLIPKLEQYRAAFHHGVFQPKPNGLCKKHCSVDTCEYYHSGAR